jgi:hypothetical protein
MVQPYDYIHKSGTAGLTLQNYAHRWSSSTVTMTGAANLLIAQSFFTGDLPLSLAALGIYCTTIGTANQRIGIYDSTSPRDIYPKDLIHNLGSVTFAGTGVRLADGGPIELAAGKLFWLVTLADGGSGAEYACFDSNSATLPAGILGSVPNSLGQPPSIPAVSLTAARNYVDNFPATFPAGATVRGGGGTNLTPAIVLEPT